MPRTIPPFPLLLVFALIGAVTLVAASSGDRNPTFQHCLKGCSVSYCDPSQPPIAGYLRAFGWTCLDNCRYTCAHSFTDNIRAGGRWHQFYGKWPFYRFGPIQEPLSVIASLGNLWANLKGMDEVKRRVRKENKLRIWLEAMAWIQINTWVWSTVFHSRDTATTELLDYFAATMTICFTLLYTVLRVPSFITPTGTSRFAVPVMATIGFLFISHWTYLLSFPSGSFPYGYHTNFNLVLASVHNVLWILWSLSFYIALPSVDLLGRTIRFPYPYPPLDPLRHKARDASTPISLVGLTLAAMSLELLDFAPIFRIADAHAMWHLATIPLTSAWWHFMANDAIELETAGLTRGHAAVTGEKMPLSGGVNGNNSNAGLGLGMTGGTDSKIEESSAGQPSKGLGGFTGIASLSPGNSPALGRSKSPVLGAGKGDRIE